MLCVVVIHGRHDVSGLFVLAIDVCYIRCAQLDAGQYEGQAGSKEGCFV